jgi:autotransporter translocation and assembly factor TamB
VEYSLSPHVKLKGTSNDEGQTSLDLLWRIDY